MSINNFKRFNFSNCVLSLLIFLAFNSCGKKAEIECPSDKHFYERVEKRDIDSFPIQNTDSLKFFSNNGDTIIFIGNGKFDSLFYIQKTYQTDECLNNIHHLQICSFYFDSVNYSTGIEFLILCNVINTHFQIKLKNTYFNAYAMADKYALGSYINNLSINGKIYNKVIKIYENLYEDPEKSYMYFSQSDGIIQINFKSGETLTKL